MKLITVPVKETVIDYVLDNMDDGCYFTRADAVYGDGNNQIVIDIARVLDEHDSNDPDIVPADELLSTICNLPFRGDDAADFWLIYEGV